MMRNIFSMINHCPSVITHDCVPATAARCYYFFAFTVGLRRRSPWVSRRRRRLLHPWLNSRRPYGAFSRRPYGAIPTTAARFYCSFAFTVGFAAPRVPASPTAKFSSPLWGFFDRPPGGQMLPLAAL